MQWLRLRQEKVEKLCKGLRAKGARFDGIQFLRTGNDGLTVQIWTEPGAPALTFEYLRAPFSP